MVQRVARRLDQPLHDVGRVVELDQLGEVVHLLLLVVPLPVGRVLVGEPGDPQLVDRVVAEEVLLVVDQRDLADLPKPLAVGLQEAPDLLGGLDDEVAPLENGFLRQLAEGDQPRRGHGLYTRSGPIRSRRNMTCLVLMIDSATVWPSRRVAGSAYSSSRTV